MARIRLRTQVWWWSLISLLCVAALVACGAGGGGLNGSNGNNLPGGGSPSGGLGTDGAGGLGATQGGIQDLTYARQLVDNGQVPPPEAFVAEGLFSEYDLALSSAPTAGRLGLSQGVGVAPLTDGTAAAWVQLSMSTDVDLASWTVPDLAVVFCLDVSGSMAWDYGEGDLAYPPAGVLSRRLVSAIANQLRTTDQVGIVSFAANATTTYPLTAGGDQAGVQDALDAMPTGGSTDLLAGLTAAFDLVRAADAALTRRVILLSDQQPNLSLSRQRGLEQLVADAAANGLGLTVVSLGLGLSQDLTLKLSAQPGGNAFAVFDRNDVDRLVADQWPFLAVPLASDLRLQVQLPAGWQVADSFGFGGGVTPSGVDLQVTSVFLSRRHGALLLQLAPPAGGVQPFATEVGFSYALPDSTPPPATLTAEYTGEATDAGGRWFSEPTVGKTVALALLVTAMHDAAVRYGSDQAGAVALLDQAVTRFDADVASLGDAALADESTFAHKLLALLRQGAEQGSLYGAVELP